MGKYADFVLLQFMVFTAALTVCAFFELYAPLAAGIALACALLTGLIGVALSRREKRSGGISFKNWVFICKAGGDERLEKTALNVFRTLRAAESSEGIIFTGDFAVAVFARFAPLSADASAALFRKCERLGIKSLHILSPNRETRAAAIGVRLGFEVRQLPLRAFYRLACGAGEVPQKTKRALKRGAALKAASARLFRRDIAARFCLAALALCLLSQVTPLQTYYLSVSALSLLFSLVCFAFSLKGYGRDDSPLLPERKKLLSKR